MKLVDMANEPEDDKEDHKHPMGGKIEEPKYPYGLGISLGNDELEKLDIGSDCEVGDTLHMMCLVKVTSVSKHETEEGARERVELQITHLSVDKGEYGSEEKKPKGKKVSNPYKGY